MEKIYKRIVLLISLMLKSGHHVRELQISGYSNNYLKEKGSINDHLSLFFYNLIRPFIFLLLLLVSFTAQAQFTINENFKNATAKDIVFGGAPTAFLTAGILDPDVNSDQIGNGWLRLTKGVGGQKGFAYINKSFPSTLGVLVDFEYKTWRKNNDGGNGADGIGVFLFDADVKFELGGLGGSLGYAPNTSGGDRVETGLSGGYIGIGLDEFGNFSNPTEGRNNNNPGAPRRVLPNSVVLRGPTTNNRNTTNEYLAGIQLNPDTKADEIDYNTNTSVRPTDAQFYRRVQIEIVPVDGRYRINVRWKKSPTGAFVDLISYLTTTVPPPNLKVGFAASTGGSFNYHEIRNLQVTTPGNMRVIKKIDKSSLALGADNTVNYTLSVTNDTDADLKDAELTDTLRDGNKNIIPLSSFQINSISYSNFKPATENTIMPLTSPGSNIFKAVFNMTKRSTADITVNGTWKAGAPMPAGNELVNTVNVMPTDVVDQDLENNTSTIHTPIYSPSVDMVLTTDVDDCALDDGNTYTIKVSNIGVNSTIAGNKVVVTQVLPAGYSVVGISASNWTQSIAGNTYKFTRTNALPAGLSYVEPIVLKIKRTNGNAVTWTNTATVAYLNSSDVDLEPVDNRGNNSSSVTVYEKPAAAPAFLTASVKYVVGETALPLANQLKDKLPAGYTLLWHTTPTGGIASTTAPILNTSVPGIKTYYVSYTNGGCEGAKAAINVEVVAQMPSLSLSKIATNVAPIKKAGDVIEYSLTVQNTGNVTLTNVAVTDAGADAGTILPANIASLAPGATATVVAKHTVTQAEVNSGSYSNQATVTGTDPNNVVLPPVKSDDPAKPGTEDPTVVPIIAAPSLSLSKIATNVALIKKAGDVVEYSLTVQNTGNVTLTNVAVTDAGADAGSILPASIASLAPGATATVVAKHTITQTEVNSGSYSNQANVIGTDPNGTTLPPVKSDDPAEPGTEDPTVVPIIATPSLSLSKIATNVALIKKAGDVIEYSLTVQNTGNVTLTDVAVTDAGADAGTILPASIASLAPGATATVVAKHTVTQAEVNSGSFSNQANVIGTDPKNVVLPPVKSDDPAEPGTEDPTVVPIIAAPSLSLSKIATNVALIKKAGDVIEYSLTVQNTGNVTLTDVAVTDAGADAGTILPASIASLAPGATATVVAKHTVTQAEVNSGSFSNQANVIGIDPNGTTLPPVKSDDPAEPGTEDPTVVPIIATPSLSLNKVATNAAQIKKAGDVIEYSLTVQNTGNVTLTNVAVTDAGADAGSILPASIASLAPGATVTVAAKHTVTQAEVNSGSFSNQAFISGEDPNGTTLPPVKSDDPAEPGTEDPTVVPIIATPSLSLNKVATNAAQIKKAGDVIEYTLTVQNTGNVTLTNVAVTDAGADAGTILPASIASLAPGATVTVAAKHTVTQAEVNTGSFSNQANVIGTDPNGTTLPPVKSDDPAEPGTEDPTVVPIIATPSLSLNKVATNAAQIKKAGDVIEYSLTVQNTGNVTLTNVAVTDAGADAGSILPASIASLAPGATATVIAKHTVTQAEINSGSFSNQANVIGTDPNGTTLPPVKSDDPAKPGTEDPTVVPIIATPSLSLNKVATNAAQIKKAGDVIEYTLTVQNTGNVTLTNVAITDAGSDAGSILPASIASLAPGATVTVAAKHTVTQAEVNNGSFSNQAFVSGEEPNGTTLPPVKSDDPAKPGTEDPTVVPIIATPSLSLNKVATNAAQIKKAGDVIEYALTVQNTGNVTLTNVAVTDAGADAGSILPASIASLAPGATVTVAAKHTVTQAEVNSGSFSNQAFVSGEEPNGTTLPPVKSDDPAKPGTEDPTVVPIIATPSLSLNKVATNAAQIKKAGDVIEYSLTVQNTGNVTLTNVVLKDTGADSIIPASIASLAPGATITATAKHTVTQAEVNSGSFSNQANVIGTDPNGTTLPPVKSDDPAKPGTEDPTVVPITPSPSLSLSKVATNAAQIQKAGDVIEYSLTVQNTGNVTLTNVAVTDAGADAGSILPANIANLAPGATVTATAKHTVTQAEVNSGSFSNQANVIGTDPNGTTLPPVKSDDPAKPGTEDPTVVQITPSPSLSLSKVATNAAQIQKAGDVIEYTLTVQNTGNVTLTNVAITDAGADAGSILPASIASLAPGATATIIAKHTVTQAEVNSGSFSNQASVTGTAPNGTTLPPVKSDDPAKPGTEDPTVVQINPSPAITVVKKGTYADANNDGILNSGDQIIYTFKVQNTGNVTLSDISITDQKVTVKGGPVTLTAGAIDQTTFTAIYVLTQADLDKGVVYNTATVTGTAPQGQKISGTSTSGNTTPPNSPENSDCPDCTITPLKQSARLALVKKITNKGTGDNGAFILGNPIAYTFTVTNTGNVTLDHIVISDPLLGKTAIALNGTLAPGASINHTEMYVITASDIANGKVINQAVVSSADPAGNVVTDKSGTALTNNEPTILILAVPPVATDDKAEAKQNTPVNIPVLANDEAGNSELLPGSITIVNPPKHGQVTVNADGTVTYTPDQAYTGDDDFTYTVTDKNGQVSNIATVKVTTKPSNPVASEDNAKTTFNKPAEIRILDNDLADGAALDRGTVEIVSQPKHGTVRVNTDGTVTYTPNNGYTGTDEFTYRVKDVNGNWTNVAAVKVVVEGFFIPNAFTPDGDGINDTFFIVGIENYDAIELSIYNRWGNQVYTQANYNNNWTGEGLNAGTYYYLIKLRKGTDTQTVKGWVLIKK